MSTKIHINETSYLIRDEHCYQPFFFKKGGELVRNPSTGEMVEAKDKFVHTGTYHTTIESSIKELARNEALSKAEYNSLQEFVEAYENAYNFLSKIEV